MNRFIALAIAVFGTGAIASELNAQIEERPRLPREVLDVAPPSERVSGNPGQVNIRPLACQNIPLAESRRRIVNIAVQEWAFFGFPIADLTDFDDDLPAQRNAALSNQANIYGFSFSPLRRGGRFRALPVGEALRVASSVVGYWAATPRGATMIDRQNQEWNGPQGLTGRWADPSARATNSSAQLHIGPISIRRSMRAMVVRGKAPLLRMIWERRPSHPVISYAVGVALLTAILHSAAGSSA
jgi:hypothetical protein